MKVNYSKPIRYVDGAPATYLNMLGNKAVVTPHGDPKRKTGNYYDENGKHLYNEYMDIENIPEVDMTFEVGKSYKTESGLRENKVLAVVAGKVISEQNGTFFVHNMKGKALAHWFGVASNNMIVPNGDYYKPGNVNIVLPKPEPKITFKAVYDDGSADVDSYDSLRSHRGVVLLFVYENAELVKHYTDMGLFKNDYPNSGYKY